MTGAPPEAPPPSDTLERLPDDFWGAPSVDDDATTEAAAIPAAADTSVDTEPGTAPVRTAAAEAPRSGSVSAGVAVLQRLFPGRVLGVEPHALEPGVVDGDIDAGGATTAVTADADDAHVEAPDEAPDEGGLESGRSRR